MKTYKLIRLITTNKNLVDVTQNKSTFCKKSRSLNERLSLLKIILTSISKV